MFGSLTSAKKLVEKALLYSSPYIDMRGVKALQYQGEETATSEPLDRHW
ncbi:hypothetical protein [Thalassotalea atypica]|nr:hypothetical protein [Thalassotalea atypica]